MLSLALIDSTFAKEQLLLLLREWYMHANGHIPGYEWNFGAANPPLHAWAAYQVYKIEEQQTGKGDRAFLQKGLSKIVPQFYLVGKLERLSGKECLSRRLPGIR